MIEIIVASNHISDECMQFCMVIISFHKNKIGVCDVKIQTY